MLAVAAALAFATAAGLALALIRAQRRSKRERARFEALRAAFQALVWEVRVREFDRLEATVTELRERGHELNNVLSTALLSTQLLFDASRNESPSPKALAELDSAADGMVEALQRLKGMIEIGRRSETTGANKSGLIRSVDLLPVLRASISRARRPGTEVTVHAPESSEGPVRVLVCAGEAGLALALDALLANACAGDGRRPASRVDVRLGVSRELDGVALEIADDGPGFTRRELGLPIAPFESTKEGAQGLGLYTAERIARASGGSLQRRNAEGGGAVVSLFLPVAT